MSLASVLQTAHTGMAAATVSVDAVGHNLANMRTNGYKVVRPVFVTQVPATVSIGSSPNASSGGINPRQIGTGVRVAGFVIDNSAGPQVVGTDGTIIELSNVDVGEELVELILAAEQFVANAAVFDVADELLDELVYLGRSED